MHTGLSGLFCFRYRGSIWSVYAYSSMLFYRHSITVTLSGAWWRLKSPPFDCLLERWFKCKSKKPSKSRVTGLSERNPSVTGGCPHKGPVMRKRLHFMTSSFPLEIHDACASTMEETVKHILNFCKTHHKPHCIKGRDRQVITIYRYCEMWLLVLVFDVDVLIERNKKINIQYCYETGGSIAVTGMLDGSNHRPFEYLFKSLHRLTTQKASNLQFTAPSWRGSASLGWWWNLDNQFILSSYTQSMMHKGPVMRTMLSLYGVIVVSALGSCWEIVKLCL